LAALSDVSRSSIGKAIPPDRVDLKHFGKYENMKNEAEYVSLLESGAAYRIEPTPEPWQG
jgi:hypothetical protein